MIYGMGFLGSLLWYSVLFVFLVAVAIAGIFVGKTLRKRKDAKASLEPNTENKEN